MEKKKYYRYEPYDNGHFILKEKMLYGADKNCFLTKEEVGDFTYDCDVYVHDDSGLETKMYIELNVDGYDFRFNQ